MIKLENEQQPYVKVAYGTTGPETDPDTQDTLALNDGQDIDIKIVGTTRVKQVIGQIIKLFFVMYGEDETKRFFRRQFPFLMTGDSQSNNDEVEALKKEVAKLKENNKILSEAYTSIIENPNIIEQQTPKTSHDTIEWDVYKERDTDKFNVYVREFEWGSGKIHGLYLDKQLTRVKKIIINIK